MRNICFNAVDRKAGKGINARGQEGSGQRGKNFTNRVVERNALRQSNLFLIKGINRVILNGSINNGNFHFILGGFKRRNCDTLASYIFLHGLAILRHSEGGDHVIHNSDNITVCFRNGFFIDKVKNRVIVDLGHKLTEGMTIGISILRNKASGGNCRGAVTDNNIVKPRLAVYRRSRTRMSGKNLQLSAVRRNGSRSAKRRADKTCRNEQDEQERAKPFYFQEHYLLSLFLNPRQKEKRAPEQNSDYYHILIHFVIIQPFCLKVNQRGKNLNIFHAFS